MSDVKLRFDGGTLLLEGVPRDLAPPGFVFDGRVGMLRGPAAAYREVVLALRAAQVSYVDEARSYETNLRPGRHDRVPRDYQAEAVEAWRTTGQRGIVVLPTGAGKSFVAELIIDATRRPTMVLAPTIDLVGQWYDGLRRAFGDPIGVLGGGAHEVEAITVSTYDSAWMHMDRYGDRFGLLVFDEVHHLPGPSYSSAARASLAPFRLGLSATPERPDGHHDVFDELVGPIVYRKEIGDLAGEFLADYETICLQVHLTDQERADWDQARAEYRTFADSRGIRLGGADGFRRFLQASNRSAEGRAALRAWREARRILQGTSAKLRTLEALLRQHHDRRVIVFTSDNATVHLISRTFLVPAITHHTHVKERRSILEAFASGALPVLVTSRVLNEGVDLPAADIAIILSGTSTVREHVQRLGRILRPQAGKHAILYELVAAGTTEELTSRRRRDHSAYQRS